MGHLQIFFPVASNLKLRYVIEKLEMFLGIFCKTVDQMLEVFWYENFRIDEILFQQKQNDDLVLQAYPNPLSGLSNLHQN